MKGSYTRLFISSEALLDQEHMWAGLDCVSGELIGWLWFAIG